MQSKTCISNSTQLYPFPNTTLISPFPTAAQFATFLYARTPSPRTLVLWADGSADTTRLGTPYAGAIGYHDPCTGVWHEHVVVKFSPCVDKGGGGKDVPRKIGGLADEAELLALREGFRVALEMVERIDAVFLFSDSHSVLRRVTGSVRGSLHLGTWNALLRDSNTLYDAGVRVEMHWVPSMALIEPHQRVDEVARDYRKLVQRVRPMKPRRCKEKVDEVRIVPGDDGALVKVLRELMVGWGMLGGKEMKRVEGLKTVGEEKKEKEDMMSKVFMISEKENLRAKMSKIQKAERKAEICAMKMGYTEAEREEKRRWRAERRRLREEKKERRRLIRQYKAVEVLQRIALNALEVCGSDVTQFRLPNEILMPSEEQRQEGCLTALSIST